MVRENEEAKTKVKITRVERTHTHIEMDKCGKHNLIFDENSSEREREKNVVMNYYHKFPLTMRTMEIAIVFYCV